MRLIPAVGTCELEQRKQREPTLLRMERPLPLAGVVPMTARLKFALEARWELAGSPAKGWCMAKLRPKSGRFEQSTLTKRHRKALAAKIGNVKVEEIRDLQCPPHFLDAPGRGWMRRMDAGSYCRTLCNRAMSILRYVHPSQEAVRKSHDAVEWATILGTVPKSRRFPRTRDYHQNTMIPRVIFGGQ